MNRELPTIAKQAARVRAAIDESVKRFARANKYQVGAELRDDALKRVGELEKQLEVVTQSWEAAEVRWDEEHLALRTRCEALDRDRRALLELCNETTREHADPGDPFYNQCDQDRCAWCEQVAAIAAREVPNE